MIKIVGIVLVGTALVLVLLRFGSRAMGTARRGSPRLGAVGWALLFLTSGRMPPPPPASQIEEDLAGKKDREASRDSGQP